LLIVQTIAATGRAAMIEAERSEMDEQDHPKGALVFMLIYLVTLALLWFNAYLRLWRG